MIRTYLSSNTPASTAIHTLSLHDALPILEVAVLPVVLAQLVGHLVVDAGVDVGGVLQGQPRALRSEEHTSELQSRGHLVCRLLLEKKKNEEFHSKSEKTCLHQGSEEHHIR